jgi:hypothetical protein
LSAPRVVRVLSWESRTVLTTIENPGIASGGPATLGRWWGDGHFP